MDDTTHQELRSVIDASDAVIAEDSDSPDPVVQRRLAQALSRKAWALGELGQYDRRLAIWDQMSSAFAEDRRRLTR